MTPMYYQMGYPYNPALQPQQQRLMEMEQQYQMGQQPMMQTQPMQTQPMPQNRQQFMKCRAVTSIDEAKASMIDLDGSVHVFTDIGNKKIYTKQINLDGTATLNTYELVGSPAEPTQAPQAATQPAEDTSYVKQAELEAVCRGFSQQIAELTARIADYENILFGEEEEPKPKPKPAPKGGNKK